MSSSTGGWKDQLRAEITEAVVKDCKDRIWDKVIDTMVLQHRHAISTLMYDVNSAQKQSMADTLVCRELKADLAEGSKTSSDPPVHIPPGDLRSPFNIDNTTNVGQGSCGNKSKETREPKAAEPTTKDGSRAKVTKAPPKRKNRCGKQMTISLQGRLIAAAEESTGGSDNSGSA